MSLNLPETKEEMLKIVGVTLANYEKYGRDLLKITMKYAEERNKFSKFYFVNHNNNYKYEYILFVLI